MARKKQKLTWQNFDNALLYLVLNTPERGRLEVPVLCLPLYADGTSLEASFKVEFLSGGFELEGMRVRLSIDGDDRALDYAVDLDMGRSQFPLAIDKTRSNMLSFQINPLSFGVE